MKDFDINDYELVKMTDKEKEENDTWGCKLCKINRQNCISSVKGCPLRHYYRLKSDPRIHKGEDKRAGWNETDMLEGDEFYDLLINYRNGRGCDIGESRLALKSFIRKHFSTREPKK